MLDASVAIKHTQNELPCIFIFEFPFQAHKMNCTLDFFFVFLVRMASFHFVSIHSKKVRRKKVKCDIDFDCKTRTRKKRLPKMENE